MSKVIERWNVHPNSPWLRGVRPDKPVEFVEQLGSWSAYGFAEVEQILGDASAFSAKTAAYAAVQVDPKFQEGDISQMDPPEQTKYRKLIGRAFSPKVIASLEPRIHEITNELLDAAAEKDGFELVADFAYPLPVRVIADLLGLDSKDFDLFKGAAFDIIENMAGLDFVAGGDGIEDQIHAAEARLKPLLDYMLDQVLQRRERPREDLLTYLIQSEDDGQRLTDNEVVNIANVLLITGHITSTMMVGNTMACLDLERDKLVQVREDRSLVPTAIEEALRLLPPAATLSRVTTRDVEIGGVTIPAEQMILPWVGAANRDPLKFDRPDEYDPARTPNDHISFGNGIHYCLGTRLARLEGRIAINALLDRYPDFTTDQDKTAFFPSEDMVGVRAMHVLPAEGSKGKA
ncbi:cytochrome P450 [Streptomyces montanus]|uniref:Cytochrome P450 n=2 Tax=Streptomyces TaxID=1883 RepID=A0A505DKN8_9ACTN|nr:MULTISPECIES: cytochrome P450 [Streptomyces]TLS39535.1 cytochrome P450 [Streptomyces montanus]TPQ22148.1 cytochrome P450 [Streptomyces sporangiiformans]